MQIITECLSLVDRGEFLLLTNEQCLDRAVAPPAMLVKTGEGVMAIIKKTSETTMIFTPLSAVEKEVNECTPMPMYLARGYVTSPNMLLLDSDGYLGIIIKKGAEIVFQIQTH